MEFQRYPKTIHIKGSGLQQSNQTNIDFQEIAGKLLVIEEKMDGSNSAVSFDNGKLLLQSRGHYLNGGSREAQFSLFKAYPGTDITNKLLEEGKINKINYDSFMYYKVDYVPEGLTEKELKNLQRKAFLAFYLRPKILWSLIREINSFEHFKFILQRTWYSFFVSK